MSPRNRFLRLVPVLLLVLLALPAAAEDPQDADAAAEAQARAYERERLIKAARGAVGVGAAGVDPFEAMQRSLTDDHAYMMAYEPKDEAEAALLAEFEKTVSERILLVGWPGSGEDEAGTEGALQEARRLDAWLAGNASCDVIVRDESAPEGTGRSYSYPPLPEAPAEPARPPEDGEAAPPGPPPPQDGSAPQAPPGAGGPKPAEAPAGASPSPAPAPAPAPAPVPAPAAPTAPPAAAPAKPTSDAALDEWAMSVVAKGEKGTLRRKIVSTAVCTVVDQLLQAARQSPVYVHPEVARLQRHAVVAQDVFSYNAPYAALRVRQAEERERAMQEDVPPPSLVDEAMVRDKLKQVERFQKEGALRREQRERVVRALDRMIDDLDGWKTQAALLAQEIEVQKRALAPAPGEGAASEAGAPPAPDAPAPISLRLAEARESLVSLDITLLYVTAVRAEYRLKLLDRLIRAADAESQSAEQAHARYQAALLKLRGARRLDRLYSDEHRLRQWVKALEEKKPEAGTVYARRLEAYRSVLAVLEVVESAVVRQREMAPGGAEEAKPDAPGVPKPVGPGVEAQGPGKESAAGADVLPAILRQPEKATWDIKYVQLAAREIVRTESAEAFDASLVARHYTAVDDRIRALLGARLKSLQEAELRSGYESARGEAVAALEALGPDDFAVRIRRLPSLLASAGEDFDAAMQGITEQAERNRERLEALARYRTLLRDQGTRSLLIRTDRDLADDDLRAAIDDTAASLRTAQRWAAFEGDDHLGHFLGASWLRLLVVLGLVVAAFVGVRFLRHRVDVWIERQAAANPVLRAAGASVREEQDEAKRRREEEHAVATVSAEAILQTGADEDVPVRPDETISDPTTPGEESAERRDAQVPAEPTEAESAEDAETEERLQAAPRPEAAEPRPETRRPADPPAGAAGGSR